MRERENGGDMAPFVSSNWSESLLYCTVDNEKVAGGRGLLQLLHIFMYSLTQVHLLSHLFLILLFFHCCSFMPFEQEKQVSVKLCLLETVLPWMRYCEISKEMSSLHSVS